MDGPANILWSWNGVELLQWNEKSQTFETLGTVVDLRWDDKSGNFQVHLESGETLWGIRSYSDQLLCLTITDP